MHSDTPVDHAEFQLTPRRTRCELLVSADGVTEKLASGFFKPFISHLQVAELEVARGSQEIRLEPHPKFSKLTGRTWFTKGTLERFVRFVSGPEVIERVKSIEDELTQLEQVRKALAGTFTPTDGRFRNLDSAISSNGEDHGRDGLPILPKWDSVLVNDMDPDASKLELLRAMDVRLTALRQEQSMAFSRAAVAGFNNENINNLMTFAENFGARHLGDACMQYILLQKKIRGKIDKHEETDYSSARAASNDFLMSSAIDTRTSQNSMQSRSTSKMNEEFTCQTHQDEFLAREDFCTAMIPKDVSILPRQGSTMTSNSSQGQNWASGDDSHTKFQDHEVKHLPSKSLFLDGSLPLSGQRDQIGSPGIGHSRPMAAQGMNLLIPLDGERKEESLIKPVEGDRSTAKDEKAEEFVSTSVRRLSVQDAINLFESKKNNSVISPAKKIAKQESCRGSMEIRSSPPAEKAVLKRWSEINLPSLGENFEQVKTIVSDNAEARKCEELGFTKNRDGESNNTVKDCKKHLIQSAVHEQEIGKNKTYLSGGAPNLLLTEQPEQNISSTTPEMDAVSNELFDKPSGVSQQQLEVDLMNDMTRDMKNMDAKSAVTSLSSKVESRNAAASIAMKTRNDIYSEPKNDSQSVVNSTILDKLVENEQEKSGHGRDNFVPTLHITVAHGPQVSTKASMEHNGVGHETFVSIKQDMLAFKKESNIVKFKQVLDNGNQSFSKTGSRNLQGERQHNSAEEFSDGVQNTPADLNMQALLKVADKQCHDPVNLSSEGSQSQLRGRFYDHYERLRDARLREAPPAKKAERQAKLKSMQETLERRKAEMKEKTLVRPKKDPRTVQTHSGVQKLQAHKAGPTLAQKAQDKQGTEEEGTDQDDSLHGYSNPGSPASTPRFSNNQALSLKQLTTKKTASTPVKPSSIAPRISTRNALVSLPRSNLKSSTVPTNLRKLPVPSQSSTMDNSMAKTAANVKDSKKETKKPSAGRMASSAKVHPKVNGNLQVVCDAILPTDSNTTTNDDGLSATPDREEMKHQSAVVKETYASVPDMVFCESLGSQQEGPTDSITNGRVRQASVSMSQEMELFLPMNQETSSESGPRSMKQEICSPGDVSKTFDGLAPAVLVGDREFADSQNLLRGTFLAESHNAEEGGRSAYGNAPGTLNVVEFTNISNRDESSSANKDQSGNIEAEALALLAEDAFNGVNLCFNTLCSDDLNKGKHKGALAVDLSSALQDSFPPFPAQKQQDKAVSALLSELLTENNIDLSQSNANFMNPAASIRVASLPHDHITNSFSPAAASVPKASMQQPFTVSGHFSPPANMALDSPLGSPASWISTQYQNASEADLVRSCRNGPQKPASVMSHFPKETAKGFKRLLHFGRKSRASEMTTTDCVSASTTSEGDDDAEETKDLVSQSCDGIFRRPRMQEKGFEFGNYGDHVNYQDQGTLQSLPSSIPAPPANFKLRDDHLAGGTLLKAPRSFFSLSTFRSRSSEGKSR